MVGIVATDVAVPVGLGTWAGRRVAVGAGEGAVVTVATGTSVGCADRADAVAAADGVESGTAPGESQPLIRIPASKSPAKADAARPEMSRGSCRRSRARLLTMTMPMPPPPAAFPSAARG